MSPIAPSKPLRFTGAEPLIPPEIRRLLGPAPLLIGEDHDSYERILVQVVVACEPSDFIDFLRCRDIADLTWKLQRFARIEGALIVTHLREALVDTLQALRGGLAKPIAPKLVDRWCTGDPQALDEVDEILGEHGTNRDAVMAQAVLRRLPVFEALGRMSIETRSQRDRVAADLKRARRETTAKPAPADRLVRAGRDDAA